MNLNDRPFFRGGVPREEMLRIRQKALSSPRELKDWEISLLETEARRRRQAGKDVTPEVVEAD